MSKNRDFNYFEAFVRQAGTALRAAELLCSILHDFKAEAIDEKVKEMHAIEHSGDTERHEIMNTLVKEFLPPIEREDITALADDIDDVVDLIEDVLLGISMYNVHSIRPDAIKFSEVLMECCKSMNATVTEFEHFKRKTPTLHETIIEVNRLEEVADKFYMDGIRGLFKSSKDPVELLVWRELYILLEKCCDSCEEVANDIENIVMKNS